MDSTWDWAFAPIVATWSGLEPGDQEIWREGGGAQPMTGGLGAPRAWVPGDRGEASVCKQVVWLGRYAGFSDARLRSGQ